jgi:hypothetical protein
MTIHVRIRVQLLALGYFWSISSGSCLTTLLTALISLRATTTWRTRWDHSASTIMRSWWKVPKRGWAHMRQTSLTQAYKNLFPNTISASIPAVTMLRSSLSMYVFLVNNNFFLIACFVNSSPEAALRIALEYEYIVQDQVPNFPSRMEHSSCCSSDKVSYVQYWRTSNATVITVWVYYPLIERFHDGSA